MGIEVWMVAMGRGEPKGIRKKICLEVCGFEDMSHKSGLLAKGL